MPFALVLLLSAGCTSKATSFSKEQRSNQERARAYDEYVSRRTAELKGLFKDPKDAATKARSEADSQFGGAPITYSSGLSWGTTADKQAEFNEQLEKMSRDKAR